MPVKSLRGDTLIEVLFSITVFAIVAVITVNLMNNGIYTAQKSLEVTMARNEIDAQAEALRFIQNSYLAERDFTSDGLKQYRRLWEKITNSAQNLTENTEFAESFNNMNNCSEVYEGSELRQSLDRIDAFILNTRLIQPESITNAYETGSDGEKLDYDELLDESIVYATDPLTSSKLQPAGLYARIIYSNQASSSAPDPNDNSPNSLKEQETRRQIAAAEGIWVIAVGSGITNDDEVPEYYDFHIRTCWHSVGRNVPSTVGTIVRLYNPEIAGKEGA